MRKSKQFISMPVISLEEGQQVGVIKGLVINPADKRVAAIAMDEKGWFNDRKFIPYGKIHNIGEDAVTVTRATTVQKIGNLPEMISLVKEKNNISGARIITENGTLLGTVDDYYVNLTTGEIMGMEFSSGYIGGVYSGTAFLDIDHVLTIGKEMIVCTNEALDKAVKLDGGLQDRLRDVKTSTGKLFESTFQKSRNLGSNLTNNVGKSISKLKRGKEYPPEQDNTPDDKPGNPPREE